MERWKKKGKEKEKGREIRRIEPSPLSSFLVVVVLVAVVLFCTARFLLLLLVLLLLLRNPRLIERMETV